MRAHGPRDPAAEGVSTLGILTGYPGLHALLVYRVAHALDAADVKIADIQLHQPSLDDVFLAKTGRKLDVGATPEPEGLAV